MSWKCKLGLHNWAAPMGTIVFKQALIEELVKQIFAQAENKDRTKRYWIQVLTSTFATGEPFIYDVVCKDCGRVDFQTLKFTDDMKKFMEISVPKGTTDDRILKIYGGALHEETKRRGQI